MPSDTPPKAPRPTDHAAPALPAGEVVCKGLPVSPGIVIGTVLVVADEDVRTPKRLVPASGVPAEITRLENAVQAAIAEIGQVHTQAEREMGAETAKIFLVHQMMLRDKSMLGQMRTRIEQERVSADYAAYAVLTGLADKFRAMGDSAFATKVNDIDDLLLRLRRFLVGGQRSALRNAPPNTVAVARDLTPGQTAGFDRSRVLAFVTDLGGLTSHTAIIAKALEIPAVVGVQTLVKQAHDGAEIIIDGDAGLAILHPSPATKAAYARHVEQRRLFRASLSEIADQPSVTIDGTPVSVVANIELPEEIEKVLRLGGGGVGLYRTEYLYLMRSHEPTEESNTRIDEFFEWALRK